LIAVDSSALVAIALKEPERDACLAAIAAAEAAFLAPINYVETGIVLRRRELISSQQDLDGWLSSHTIQVSELELSGVALSAYLSFGKGRHPARLNLGDCFAYALAKQLGAPLLYKGDDFALTDIRAALQPT
jgi:ribonuclease VapC